jgi:hypothetical protein
LAIFDCQKNQEHERNWKSGLCMAGVMILDTLRQQTLAASLAPTRESGAAALCFHSRTKTMLAFARSFRCLIGAFHGAVERTGTVKVTP